MPRYRSWSDSNQRQFEDALDAEGIPFRVSGTVVETDEDVDALAEEWGMTKKVKRDAARSRT